MKTKIGILGFKDSESQRLVSEIIKDFQNYKINNIEKIDHSNLNDDMDIAMVWNPGIEVGHTSEIIEQLSKNRFTFSTCSITSIFKITSNL